MKPNEYKAYRKMEAAITEFLDREDEFPGMENRMLLTAAVSDILGRDLEEADLAALDKMVEDEKQDGTIDFSDLDKYGIYREPSVIPVSEAGFGKMPQNAGISGSTSGIIATGTDPVLAEQTLSMIRRQLADITYIEHYLQDMKKELIEMTEKLSGIG